MTTMTASLPDNAKPHLRRTDAATVPWRLQGMRAGAASFFVRPLFLGSAVEYMRRQPFLGGPGPHVDDGTLDAWLQTAHAVESAHRTTVAWLRSRLPGYPMLLVPQLTRNTHLTTNFYSGSIVWLRAEFAAGHQFDNEPRDVPAKLGANAPQMAALRSGACALADAFKATPEWFSFDTTCQQLTSSDRTALQAARRGLRERLTAVDNSAADIFQQDALRRQYVEEAVEALVGLPHAYCKAFEAVNRLIELAAGDVFGQLVAYGDPKIVPASGIDFSEPSIVNVITDDPFGCHPGDLVRIDDPLVNDALRVEGSVSQFDVLNLKPSTLTLRILDGTAVWFSQN
ncbi:hypothetical protein [Arthrobacter sp. H5]|uniref:hypothetical protein n=1 Tax=Arthrobacter sp. H5 TaxID=1267973 RepID=UPI001C1E4E9E|nr:hypothetical protein [Arthrobacter sp. H5]